MTTTTFTQVLAALAAGLINSVGVCSKVGQIERDVAPSSAPIDDL